MAKDEAAELEHAVLGQAQVTLEDFGRVHVDGTRRMGRLLVNDLAVEADDEGLVLRFELRKGAFATTVLREVMKLMAQRLLPLTRMMETSETEVL